MKYSSSAPVVKSRKPLQANVLKIALHHRYFFKKLTTCLEQQDWKKISMATSEDNYILRTFLTGCFSKAAAKIVDFKSCNGYTYIIFLGMTSC